MNDQMNTPMSPEPSEPAGYSGWFQTWVDAVTKPNEQTFARLATSPNAKLSTAFLWVFLGSLISFFFVSLVQNAYMGQVIRDIGLNNGSRTGFGITFVTAICGAPIGGIISVVTFAVFTGVVQWVAKMFGGTGTFEQLAYAFAAITFPFSVISALLSLLGAIPFVGFCFGILGFVAAIYVIALELMAVKGVNGFGWGQAAGSLFLPGIVLLCCIAVVVFGLVSLLAPAIRDTFNQFGQGF